MSKKIFFTLLLSGILTGCSTPAGIIERRDIFVYVPPDELFHCPKTQFDFDVESLHEDDVAELILKRGSDLDDCRNNMKAIRDSLLQAEKEFNEG